MYLADYHIHSNCSPDGCLTVAEMTRAAIERGLDEICMTDHVDPFHWRDRSPCTDFDWAGLKAQFDEAQALYGDRIAIKLGCELGDAPYDFARSEHLLSTAPELDFIIGSVHLAGEAQDWLDLYFIRADGDAYYHAVIESYLDELEKVARWGKCSVLGHLTLPLRYINENYHRGLTFDAHRDHVAEILRIAIANGIGIECNTNRGNEPLPGPSILRLYRDLGGEIITLGSDAHSAESVGCAIALRQELLRECGFRCFTTFTKGRPEFRAL